MNNRKHEFLVGNKINSLHNFYIRLFELEIVILQILHWCTDFFILSSSEICIPYIS